MHSVSALSHDSMSGRATGSVGLHKAAQFIAGRFKEAGLSIVSGNNGYFSNYQIKVNGIDSLITSSNIVGGLKGKISPDTIVIFSAHYDHIGHIKGRSSKDTVFNGANDNASGTALLIELAKYYRSRNDNRYTILFVAFTDEEIGLVGSRQFVTRLDKTKVHAVINFDMVGRPINSNYRFAMVIGEYAQKAVSILNRELGSKKKFFIRDQFPYESLMYRMDHYSFPHYKNCFSIITSSPNDKYYHRLTDEFDTIDFPFLLMTTQNVAAACVAYTK